VEEHAENRGPLKTNKNQATSGVAGDLDGEVPEIRRGALDKYSFIYLLFIWNRRARRARVVGA